MKTLFISCSIFIATTVFIIGFEATEVSNCVSTIAPLPEVEIVNCTVPPCAFYINSTGIMTMKFRAPRYLEHIAPRASASFLGLSMDYPLDETDACDGITNTPCPLAANEYIEYTFGMFILPVFPTISLILEFSLLDLDQNSDAFVCFRADLSLEAP